MTSRTAWIAGLLGVAAFASAPRAEAQIGGLPAAGTATPAAGASALGAAPAVLGAAPAAAAQPTTLWGFLGLSKTNLAACKAKICASQIGQLLNSMTVPASGFTGGIVPLLCPPVPTAAQLAAMQGLGGAGGAQAVAAKIMQDEADAKARVAAVEYLGTVDCRYWKEARDALINALRSDRNECVRFAAARVLGSGCCCSKEVIEKLRIVVSGEEDKDPAEASPRVRAAAFAALQNCLAKVPEVIPPEEPVPLTPEGAPAPLPDAKPRLVPERSAMAASDPANVAVGYLAQQQPPALSPADEAMRRKTFSQTIDDARRTMFDLSQTARPAVVLPPGKQSVFHALAKARQDVDVTVRRRAAAQGVQTPTSRPASNHEHATDAATFDPGVNPTSYVVPTNPTGVAPRGDALTADDAQASMNKRGLLGYFLKPKVRAAGFEE
jgi:hypothetical protein